MATTGKRQRHKQGHRSRVEAARVIEAKRRRVRSIVIGVGALTAVVLVFVAVKVTSNDDKQKVTSGSSTSTTAPTSASSAPVGVQLPTPPAGRTITTKTPCPGTNALRTTTFKQAPPVCIDPKQAYRATITTSEGPIVVDLDAAQSPSAVNNFVVLARYHYFDGVPFHRIIPGFLDQTGSSGRPDFGSGGPGYSLPDEKPKKPYAIGTVAMGTGSRGVSGSQFFFTLDPSPLAGGGYPILGKVADAASLATVKTINGFGTASEAGEPTKVVTIEKVAISGP